MKLILSSIKIVFINYCLRKMGRGTSLAAFVFEFSWRSSAAQTPTGTKRTRQTRSRCGVKGFATVPTAHFSTTDLVTSDLARHISDLQSWSSRDGSLHRKSSQPKSFVSRIVICKSFYINDLRGISVVSYALLGHYRNFPLTP